jgi:hypothetical protein
VTEIVTPDRDLLARAVHTFLKTDADTNLYDSAGGGLATQGPTVNYWFLL